MSMRAVILGVVLSFIIAIGEPYGVGIVHGSAMCADFSTGAAVFLFFLVGIGNLIARRVRPQRALAPSELALVYIMMTVACAVVSWGFVMNLIAIMPGVHYFSALHPDWVKTIHPHLPWYLFISDERAARAFYDGLPAGESIPWGLWLKPLAWWFSFMMAVSMVGISLAVILRRQWSDHERLSYPLTQVPLEMVRTEGQFGVVGSLWSDKLAWLGFAVPFIYHSINSLHRYLPAVPQLMQRYNFNYQHGDLIIYSTLRLYFEVIGLAYLLASDVSLSLWFFPVFNTLQGAVLKAHFPSIPSPELMSGPGIPPVAFQGLGAMAMLVGLSLYRGRVHLAGVWRKAWHPEADIDDSGEALPYRWAILGVLIGSPFIVWWLAHTGLGWTAALAMGFFAFILFVGLARVVAQTGLAYGRAPVAIPVATLHTLGTAGLGPTGMSALVAEFTWAADLRTAVIVSAANGVNLANVTGLRGKGVGLSMLLAVLTALLGASWMMIRMAYTHTGVALGGWHLSGLTNAAMTSIAGWIAVPVKVDPVYLGYAATGAGVFYLLTAIRELFIWFPIHPIGYCLGLSGPVFWVWFSVFIAWVCKVMVLHYAGLRGYVMSRRFFLGMMVGSFTAAGVWLIIDAIFGMQGNLLTLD